MFPFYNKGLIFGLLIVVMIQSLSLLKLEPLRCFHIALLLYGKQQSDNFVTNFLTI